MARMRAHLQRAGRGNGSAYWISYSDIMAALVLVFVLFIVFNIYQYNTLIDIKTRELEDKQAQLDEFEGILIIQQGKLDEQSAELDQLRLDLDAKETELENQTIILIGQQQELDEANARLAAKENELANLQIQLQEQETAFRRKTAELSAMVGVRAEIVSELSRELSRNTLDATIDENGNITLKSTVFFDTNKYTIRADGQAQLNAFLPVYLGVLLRPEYADFLGEIIVEGHTDSDGEYVNNLRLSQNRALAVVIYCLDIVDPSQRTRLQSILTAQGRSSSDPVYYHNADGSLRLDGNGRPMEDKASSRRVEFKFTLRDAEMIDEMNQILQQNGSDVTIVMPETGTP